MATKADFLAQSGLDALELDAPAPVGRVRKAWAGLWPQLGAIALAIAAWQVVVWTHWRPEYVLPGPRPVFSRLGHDLGNGELLRAVGVTLRRAIQGYGLALIIGIPLGIAVARVRLLRAAVGSLLTGLQTMPSIAWFPFAILLFKLNESAIIFVVVMGATPSIANGVISGIDTVAPVHLRAARVLGAKGLALYRYVILPAALPGFLGGLKQGWAFAWRSLLAGELLVIVPGITSVGVRLQNARDLSDAEGLLAVMIVILVIGIVVDRVVFAAAERVVLQRRGLGSAAP